jgi:energy-coupling factor transporter ATP-binding protein EcfA2
LIAEHKTDLLAESCDRVVVMEGGRIVDDGPAAAILAEADLADRGIDPPARVRLERALAARGLDPGILPR